MLLVAAALLLASLFMTWSHQFSAAFLGRWGSSNALRGVPRDPTAWQVYSIADALLALLAFALVIVALRRTRVAIASTAAGVLVAVAFTAHALAVPPTNGADIFDPALSVPNYAPSSPAAGPGETVALVALGLAAAGLALVGLAGRRPPPVTAIDAPRPAPAS